MNLKQYLKNASPHERELFTELCKRVALRLEDVELRKDGKEWMFPFEDYTWTREAEDNYKDWLVEYVYKNRREFHLSFATKKMIRDRYVGMFLLSYSWKYND